MKRCNIKNRRKCERVKKKRKVKADETRSIKPFIIKNYLTYYSKM